MHTTKTTCVPYGQETRGSTARYEYQQARSGEQRRVPDSWSSVICRRAYNISARCRARAGLEDGHGRMRTTTVWGSQRPGERMKLDRPGGASRTPGSSGNEPGALAASEPGPVFRQPSRAPFAECVVVLRTRPLINCKADVQAGLSRVPHKHAMRVGNGVIVQSRLVIARRWPLASYSGSFEDTPKRWAQCYALLGQFKLNFNLAFSQRFLVRRK